MSEVKKFLGSDDPLIILKKQLSSARKSPLKNPWAFCLSTSAEGRPSSRIVLLKYIKDDSLVFFSNYLSFKGESLRKNPLASALFYWDGSGRQIRVEGRVKKLSQKESAAYWKGRARGSQISQWLSRQSHPISDRKSLEALWLSVKKRFAGRAIPRPRHWGGYALSVRKIEFWMENEHRLHDRFLFERRGRSWKIRRLFP